MNDIRGQMGVKASGQWSECVLVVSLRVVLTLCSSILMACLIWLSASLIGNAVTSYSSLTGVLFHDRVL